jgi:hypothetical protein
MVLDEILEERVVASCKRWNPRVVKRKMSKRLLRPRYPLPGKCLSIAKGILILKRTVLGLIRLNPAGPDGN